MIELKELVSLTEALTKKYTLETPVEFVCGEKPFEDIIEVSLSYDKNDVMLGSSDPLYINIHLA